jgi:hypothetical protein
MQIEGINYLATYALIVSLQTVCFTLILSLLPGLKSRQVNYMSAYTQAPLDCTLPGFIVTNGHLHFILFSP